MSKFEITTQIDRHMRVLNKVIDKLYGQMLNDDIIENEKFEWEKHIPMNMVFKMSNYCKTRRHVKYAWILLTVNPMEGTDIEELMKKTEKCAKKIWIKHAEWCYEWREGETGLHMHMAILTNDEIKKKCSEMRRECYNTFKHLIGDAKHVNMKFSNQCPFNNYVKGIKAGEPKYNAKHDVENRVQYGLKPTYECGGE